MKDLRALLIAAILFLLPMIATAESGPDQIESRLQEIRTVENDIERLSAYDNLVEQLGSSAAPPTQDSAGIQTGNWIVDRTADPVTDQTRVTMILPASSGGSSYGGTPALVIRQQGQSLDIYVSWHDYLSEDRQMVTHRIDDGTPETLRWSVSTDNSATFYPRDTLKMVQNLLDAQRLVVRTTPYNDSPVTLVFALEGLAHAADQYRDDLPGWFEDAGGR